MTVSSATSKISYAGDGSTVVFPVPFRFILNADVVVTLRNADASETSWTEGTQYTLTGTNLAAGGTLTVSTSPTDYTPASGTTLVIKRVPTETQESRMPLGGDFPSTTVEDSLDKLTMLVQAHSEELSRAFTLSSTSSSTPSSFPDVPSSSPEDYLLGYDSDGELANVLLSSFTAGTFDVVETSLAANDTLVYDGSQWENKAPAAARTALGLTNGATLAHKLDATTSPGTSNDTDEGYSAGSLWVDVTGDISYICLDATADAAVWGQATGASSFPAGMIVDYAGTSAPTGWLLCFGQAVSRTTYSTLFAAISTTYGVGDGSTTFNLPDLRGRVVAGKDDMGGSSANRLTDQTGGLDGDTLGDTGGNEVHVLTSAQLAAHTHTGTTDSDGAHTHSGTYVQTTSDTNIYRNDAGTDNVGTSGSITSGGAHTHTFTSASTGSDSGHNNVQPTIILNKIIKT